MSLSCRCMSTPNGASPLLREVMSEQAGPWQRVLHVADAVDQVSGIFTGQHLAVANPRADGDRQIAERVRGHHVCFAVAEDDRRVVIRHRLADQSGLLECWVRTRGSG